jgi:agmatinase
VCINTFDPVEPLPGDAGKSLDAIRATAGRIISDGKFVVGLGGEHTVTFPLVQAAAEAHGTLHVLQIDAHLDLRDVWEGNPWNHACVMRRVVDAGHTVVPVGIRNVSAEEHKFITRTRLDPFFAREIVGREDWQSEVLDRLVDPVYITIDTDGFDLSVISSVGTPEPGGLGWAETLDLLRDVFEQKRVVGCDVVELAPDEHDEASNFTAARLVAKLIAYHEFL